MARPRRRWPIVVIAALAVAFAVGVPVRAHLARDELRWIERQSAQSLADDKARAGAEQKLKAFLAVSNGPSDQATVNGAVAALYQEEQARFDALRARLHRAVLVDGRLLALRRDVVQALVHRARLFAAVAAYYRRGVDGTPPAAADNQSAGDFVRVSHDIAAARERWHDSALAPAVTAAPYPAATVALTRLAHWLDEPTGAVLLANSGNRVVRLDVDASRETTTDITPDSGSNVVARQGYVAYIAKGTAWAVAADGSGVPRALGPAGYLLAADNPETVWVVDNTTFTATEIHGRGQVVRGPETSPGVPEAATSGALIETQIEPAGPGQLFVWILAAHQVGCRLSATGFNVLGTSGNLVAWSAGSSDVHVSDVTTCRETRHVASSAGPPTQPGAPLAAFSPDGRSLAVATAQADLPGDQIQLQVLDLTSGAARTITNHFDLPLETIVWTNDSRRLFWIYGGPLVAPTLLVTWRVGARQTQVLRITTLNVAPPLLAAS